MKERRSDYPALILTIDEIHKIVKDLEEDIKGNGQPGLKERMNTVEKYIKNLDSFHVTIQRTLIGCTGTIIASIIISMLVNYIRLPK